MKLHKDLIENILEKLSVKSLLRFKSVSIEWKSIIESQYFKKRQLVHQQQSQDPNILLINPLEFDTNFYNFYYDLKEENVTRIFMMASSELIKLSNLCPPTTPLKFKLENFPEEELDDNYSVTCSCDGMICYYNDYNCIYVINPNTRWFRSVPRARCQNVYLDMMINQGFSWEGKLGFGKDKFTDTYKLVWFYTNSFQTDFDQNATTCEVFDFNTNAWRYVPTLGPCRVFRYHVPVYVNGSIYWFIDEYKVLYFDLHTEKFHIISKTPFHQPACDERIIMCTMNNQLCVSQQVWPRQDIWSLDISCMTWNKIYSLNLQTDFHLFATDDQRYYLQNTILCAIPLAILKKKKKKNSLVLYDPRADNPTLIVYDPDLKSYDICFTLDSSRRLHFNSTAVSCFSSLISIV